MPNESKTLIGQLQEAQTLLASNGERITALEAEKAELANKLELSTKELTDAKASADASAAALDLEKSEHAKTKQELDGAKARLANPAFIDASAKGSAGAGAEGGVAGEGGGESIDSARAHAEYAKLTDAKAKQEFRRANWKALGIKEEK